MKIVITILLISIAYAIPALATEAKATSTNSFIQQIGPNSLPDTTNKQKLLKKSRESKSGFIRVIVTYDMEYDRSALAHKTQRQVLHQEIETLHNRFLNEINSKDLKISGINKSRYGPRVSLSVNKEALERLYKMEMINNIREVRYFKANLDQSTAIVQANDSWEGFGLTGDGETIVIIDTGVDYNHEMLSGKVVDGACFSTNDANSDISSLCPNGQESEYGVSAGDDCGSTTGCDHGTHVAGIAAGNATNLKGVANGADIISIQVFSLFDNETICSQNDEETPCILIADDDLEDALNYTATLSNISAVNMSLGGGDYTSECDSDPLKDHIDNLYSMGIITVAASGNENYGDALNSPACISSVISVGATNDQDEHWSVSDTVGSNAASFLDLVAPGVSISSSVPGPSNQYASFTGTSMAAPHVAGTIALMREADPYQLTSNYRTILRNTADNVSQMHPYSFTDEHGHGRLNSFEAVARSLINNPSVGVFDYNYTYNSQQTAQFENEKIYIMPGYTLTVNGTLSLYNTNLYILGTLEGTGSIDLMGDSDIYERLDGENNFTGDTTIYGDVYPVTVRNDFNGYNGGQIGVGRNTSPTVKSSPDTSFFSNDDVLNLKAYDNQTWNGYTWVFNNTEGSTNKSRWYIKQHQSTDPISDSYNQSPSYEVDDNQGAEIYNVQKRKLSITRNDYSPELGNNINSTNASVVEGNELTAPLTQTDNGIKYHFIEWSDGETDRSRTINSPISSLTAHYKGIGLSNDDEAYTDNSQRRLVQTAIDGEVWLHRAYASMGHIWLEHSSNGGSTWTLGNDGKPLDGDSGGAKNPSIAHTCDDFNPGEVCHVGVVWQEKYGTKYKIKGKLFTQWEEAPLPGYGTSVTTLHTEPSDNYTVNAHPNLALSTEVGSPYLITFERKSTSGNYSPGINWLVGYVTGGGVAGPLGAVQEKGVISGTDASTLHAQPSLASSEQHQIGVNVIRQQGTGSSGKIYAHFISLTDIGPLNNIENSDWQVFQYDYGLISYPYDSSSPSIVTYPTSTQGSTGYFSACWTEYGLVVYINSQYPTIMYNLGPDVGSCSIASNGGTQGFMVWSEQPGANWVNKSLRFSGAFPVGGTEQTLSTQGKYVQVASSATSSLSNIYVSSFSPVSVPYNFKTSGTLGPVSKKKADETVESRGFMLTLGNGESAFKYRFGELNVDEKNIFFVETPDTADYGNLETLNNVLLTEPFQVNNNSEIVFTERPGIADSAAAAKALAKGDYIRYKLELIDETTGQKVGTLREENFTASKLRNERSRAFAVSPAGVAGKTVRARITLETNLVKQAEAASLRDDIPEGIPESRINRHHSNLVLIKHYREAGEAADKSALEELITIEETPESYSLAQNYPNPFNPSTVISYQLPENTMVQLAVYDLLGRRVQTLVNEQQSTGNYNVTFDASNLASGVYLYRLQAGEFTASKKLFLIK